MALQPYPGLRPFEPDETDIFFGRESHVDAMVNRLAQHRLLAVTGTSGSGKSSLVKAGLIEALEIGLLAEAGAVWHIAQLRPRDHPMAELAAALISALGGDRYEHDIALRRAALERGPLALVEELVERPLPGGANLFILVDQFEELFRYRGLAGREEAEAFVALLLASAGQRTVPIYIVLTMRSDYFGECAQFQGLAEAVSDAQYLCPRLTREQITAAIESPAAVFGGKVEPLLVSRMLNDMGTDPDQLPLMQHALMRLWDEAKVRDATAPVLRLEDYLAVDGLKGSLSRHADEILAEVTDDAPRRAEIARRLFCLVTEGEGERAVRRLARVGEVMDVSGEPLAEVTLVADAFRAPGRSLLMPPLERPLDPETVLDISHESLIRQWQTLKDWVWTEAASAEQYRDTGRRARRWAAGEAGFWEGMDLDIGLAWREREHPNAAWAERYGGNFALAMRFLDESRERRDIAATERRAAARRRQQTMFAVTGVAVAFAVFAGVNWYDSNKQRNRADSTLALAKTVLNVSSPHGVPETEKLPQQIEVLVEADSEFLPLAAISVIGAAEAGLPATDLDPARAPLDSTRATIASIRTASGLTGATIAIEILDALAAHDPNNIKLPSSASPSDFDKALDDYRQRLPKLGKLAQTGLGYSILQHLWQMNEGIGNAIEGQHPDYAADAYRYSIQIEKELAQRLAQGDQRDLWRRRLATTNKRRGDALRDQGNSDGARDAYREALNAAKDLGGAPGAALDATIGEALKSTGSFAEALDAYRSSVNERRELAEKNPGNSVFQYALILSHKSIGDLFVYTGPLDEAIAAYRKELDVAAGFAENHPTDNNGQLWLAMAEQDNGDAVRTQSQLDEALTVYGESLNIREGLADKFPGNSQWQFLKAMSKGRVSSVLAVQGQLDNALLGYNERLEIYKKLESQQTQNILWRQYTAESYNDVGDVLKHQGSLRSALETYQNSLKYLEGSTQGRPANPEWQSELSRSRAAIGEILAAQGDLGQALTAYQNTHEIRADLAAKDPSIARRRDLATSHRKIGDVLVAQGRFGDSLPHYRASLTKVDELASKDPSNALLQSDLAESYEGIGEVLKAQGSNQEALEAFKRGLDIRRTLAQKTPSNVVWQTALAVSLYRAASVGDEAKVNLAEAHEILKRLEHAGTLWPSEKGWIAKVETALAEIKT